MTPFVSVAMHEKLALLKIAVCNAPAISKDSSSRDSVTVFSDKRPLSAMVFGAIFVLFLDCAYLCLPYAPPQEDAGPSLSETNLCHLTTISKVAKRMENLIDDLLTFAHVGQSQMESKEVNLDQLVQEVLSDFQADTTERNIAWDIRPLPTVPGDCRLLRLALVNLLSNAVKFTATRSQAKIEIGCAPGGDAETVIFIRDNGAGFDPSYADKLFGVFQRLHSQEEFAGTGIGLANVQRIIHRHGGRVWAEGVVDGGATFYFSIPNKTESPQNLKQQA